MRGTIQGSWGNGQGQGLNETNFTVKLITGKGEFGVGLSSLAGWIRLGFGFRVVEIVDRSPWGADYLIPARLRVLKFWFRFFQTNYSTRSAAQVQSVRYGIPDRDLQLLKLR